jgi:hypothetical protein
MLRLISSPLVPIERTFAFVGEYGNLVVHFDKTHFNQRSNIVRTNRLQFGALGFDIAQDPAETDRRVWA